MTDRSGETKAKRSFGRRAAKEGGVPRKSLAGVLVALLCALCFSVPLSGQTLRVDTALVRMARGEVQEYVIPQMASLEQPGIVRSGYRTVYPSGWTLGKASLSDGEGLINFFVIRLQGPVQKAQTADTFYDEKARGVRRAVPGFGVFPHPGGKRGGTGRVLSFGNARWGVRVGLFCSSVFGTDPFLDRDRTGASSPGRSVAAKGSSLSSTVRRDDPGSRSEVGRHACFLPLSVKTSDRGGKRPFFMTISWQGFCRNEVCEIFKRKSHETPQ